MKKNPVMPRQISDPVPVREQKKEPYLDPKIANHPANFLRTRPIPLVTPTPTDYMDDLISQKNHSALLSKDK